MIVSLGINATRMTGPRTFVNAIGRYPALVVRWSDVLKCLDKIG